MSIETVERAGAGASRASEASSISRAGESFIDGIEGKAVVDMAVAVAWPLSVTRASREALGLGLNTGRV